MADIAAFLRDRYDEDEARARSAAEKHGEDWTARPGANGGAVIDGTVESRDHHDAGLWDSEGSYLATTEEAGAHIAANDPIAVLRDIAAKRKIVARYQKAVVDDDNETDHEYHYVTAGVRVALHATLALLAEPFSGDEDYAESWRP